MSKKLYRAPGCVLLSESADENGLVEIQLLKTGNFFDPRYGKFSLTRKMFSEMIDNFKKGTRGIDIALDYAHNTEGISAAWFKDVYEKPIENGFGLFAKVEPTGSGKKSLAEKEYRYVSADFDPNYKDNEKGLLHGCVLEGAALTNRPVIKGMQAIQLSELNEGDIEMMTIEEAMAKIAELEAKLLTMKPADKPDEGMQMTEQEKKEMELKDAKILELEKSNKELSEAKLLAEKSNKFNIMLSEGRAVEAQRASYIAGDMDEFAKLSVKVKLSEEGTEAGNAGSGETESLEDQMVSDIAKLQETEKLQLSEATKRVARLPKYASLVTK